MAHFKLIPINKLFGCIEFDAVSAASILDIASRSPLGETDVYCDEAYRCTVNHGATGVWTVTQRKNAVSHDGAAGRVRETIRTDSEAQFSRQQEMA